MVGKVTPNAPIAFVSLVLRDASAGMRLTNAIPTRATTGHVKTRWTASIAPALQTSMELLASMAEHLGAYLIHALLHAFVLQVIRENFVSKWLRLVPAILVLTEVPVKVLTMDLSATVPLDTRVIHVKLAMMVAWTVPVLTEVPVKILTMDLSAPVPLDTRVIHVKLAKMVARAVPVLTEGPVKALKMASRVYAQRNSLVSCVSLPYLQPFLKEVPFLWHTVTSW